MWMIDLKTFKILFDMTRIGWIIIGILVYFLLGWILKDIVFSIITIESDTTMGDILKYEQIVYSALTAIYIIIMDVVQGDENGDSGLPIILVIAALVQFVEMFMKTVMPPLYNALGIFLPLITTNCAVLGVALNNVKYEYSILESVVNGFATGVGYLIAIVLLAGIREKMEYNDIPESFQGMPIVLLTAALMSIAFFGFSGLI